MRNSPTSKISFFSELEDFELHDPDPTSQWLDFIFTNESVTYNSVTIIFCSDDQLLKINQEYLGHDDFTDIITFSYNESPVEGEMYISKDRVQENALLFNEDFTRELRRVMAHGILHLVGYGDKEEGDRKVMREKEEFYLSRFTK